MHLLTRSALLAATVLLSGCELLVSDSASRTAFALREGAHRLAGSGDTTLTVRITPREWPEGCRGPYRVDFAPDTAAVPGLAFRCLPQGRVYTSGDAIPLVRSRSAMAIERRTAEPMIVVLRKNGTGIDLAGFSDE